MSCTREHLVEVAKRYIGYNEDDGSYMEILRGYDEGLVKTDVCTRWHCRRLKFSPNPLWHWCAAFCSFVSYKANATDTLTYEMSVWSHMEPAKRAGIWKPYGFTGMLPGDFVVFDWGGGHSDCDHIGIIASVNQAGKYFTTIEGNTGGHGSGDNYKGTVGTRKVSFTNNIVTGFIHPNFDKAPVKEPVIDTPDDIDKLALEVIRGLWGNGTDRKKRLTNAGHNYDVVQARVNAILKGTPVKEDENKPEYYTVVKGDTLCKISKKYGLTLKVITALNPQIKNPDLIYVGDKIRVR